MPLKTILTICFSILVFGFLHAQDEVLVWSDEFNVDGAPNPLYWGYDLGTNNGWGNNEVQNYTTNSTNVKVEGGVLKINAIKSGGSWTSARIKTQTKLNFTYGRIKFNAKLPTGGGTWPALWMLGENITTKNWPACGEIDVMEHVGNSPSIIHSSLHSPSSYGNTINTQIKSIGTYNTAFHTYEAIWTPNKIQFLIDGISFYTYQPAIKNNSTWPFNTPFFMIMNIAMGGNFGGAIDPALSLAELQIDYVRVYQSFSQQELIGPKIVEKNQTGIQYSIIDIPGATYQWTIPSDAQVTSGVGTNKITVTWGQTEGDVKVNVVVDANSYEKSLSVFQVVKPQGNSFPLISTDFNILWSNNGDNPNPYSIISQNPLRVDYTVITKMAIPSLYGSLYRALDLSDHPVLKVNAKSFNKSNTLNMRVDLVDENGKTTNKAPVFELAPIIDDGEYYEYAFNFQDLNQWKSGTGDVNKTRITKINLYIDYGVLSVLGSDSLWIDTLWVEQPIVGLAKPNRPSHLSGVVSSRLLTLTWQDNATNEDGFEVFRSLTKDGPYVSVSSSAANTTSTIITQSENEPSYFYTIKSFNSSGNSSVSNIITVEDFITANEKVEFSDLINVYPNPSTGRLFIDLPYKSLTTIRISNALGIEVYRLETMEKNIGLNLIDLPKGIYFLETISKRGNSIRKIILQ